MSPAQPTPPSLKVMVIGIEEISEKVIAPSTGHLARITHPYDLEKLMEIEPDPSVGAIFCGPPPAEIALSEIAQMLRMQYQHCPIYYLTTVRVGFDRKTIQKNGFTDAFLIPFDAKTCETAVREALALRGAAAEKVYRAVKIIDVTPGEVLTFDAYLHLPTNNKYVKFAVSGEPLEADRAERLKKHQVKNLQVTIDQMQEFYKFTASHLKKIGENATMSETERQEKLQSSVRELIGGIFSDNSKDGGFETGKSIVEDCQQIVKAFIVQDSAKNDWFARFMNMANSAGGVYNHATNVATFAGLFSMGMGIGKPEEMAMAGILHDIGISELPVEIQLKPEKELTKEEFEIFKKHIDQTIKLIKDRKLIVPETVSKAITQHHERWNGSGYPKALIGKRICPEAQLLALADLFDELTSERADGSGSGLNPVQALFKIREMNGLDSSTALFDPEMIAKLFKLFPIDLSGQVAA